MNIEREIDDFLFVLSKLDLFQVPVEELKQIPEQAAMLLEKKKATALVDDVAK